MRSTRRTIAVVTALAAVLAAAWLNTAAPADDAVTNPVIPGDHPDPTIVQVGSRYYATATTGKWAPVFPLMRSTNLRTWEQVGPVFPTPPKWTVGNYWAPELVRWNKRMLVFYSASRRGGKPCIGVGSARRPEGPWRDRGPALCLPGGTIDAAPFTDKDGSRWLLYKAMGVGGGLWIVRFDERTMRAVGRPTLLIKPDRAWEQGTTEGPSLVLRDGRYHLFYAGGHCCRPPCTYSEGVARADSLLGPYVKHPDNPIMTGDDTWKCPGHGTVIDLGARGLMLVHHAYRRDDPLNRRRHVLATPVRWGEDGWARLGEPTASAVPAGTGVDHESGFDDPIRGGRLQPGWEWPFDRPPGQRPGRAGTELSCRGTRGWPTFVARQVQRDGFAAGAWLEAPRGTAAFGLTVIDPEWIVRGVELRAGKVRQMRAEGGRIMLGPAVPAPAGRRVELRLHVGVDGRLAATVRAAGGRLVPVPAGPADAGTPPTRVAVSCRGTGDATVTKVRARAFD